MHRRAKLREPRQEPELKDQTNLIVIIVAIVFMIGWTLGFALSQRKTVVLQDPAVVPVAPVSPQEGAVVFANALPNAGKGAATGGAGAGGGALGGNGQPRRGPITADNAGGR